MSYPEQPQTDTPTKSGYLHSTRRKLGLVAIFVACGFLGLWSRSFLSTNDQVTVWNNHSLYSHDGSVSWNIRYTDPQAPVQTESEQPESETLATMNTNAEQVAEGETSSAASQPDQGEHSEPEQPNLKHRIGLQLRPRTKAYWKSFGLVYQDSVIGGSGITQYWVSYWYFITPPALLAAWLLLSKRRTQSATMP